LFRKIFATNVIPRCTRNDRFVEESGGWGEVAVLKEVVLCEDWIPRQARNDGFSRGMTGMCLGMTCTPK